MDIKEFAKLRELPCCTHHSIAHFVKCGLRGFGGRCRSSCGCTPLMTVGAKIQEKAFNDLSDVERRILLDYIMTKASGGFA